MKGKDPCVCFYCKEKPKIIEVSDCYYVQCVNCNKWYLWEFCGTSKASVVKQWNDANKVGRHFSGE